jgi:hypothetical protein
MEPERQSCAGGGIRTGPARVRQGCAVAVLGALLAMACPGLGAGGASAQGDCQTAFDRWAKLSNARVRGTAQNEGRGDCIPSEAMRKELLGALSRTRGLCAGPDQGGTRTMLDINQAFVNSLVLCRPDATDQTPPSPNTADKEPPAEEPKVVAPAPPAPPPAPKPPPQPKKVVIAPPPPSPPCLEIAPGKVQQYALVNRHCRGHTVFAVIETRGAGGETVCKGHTINQSLTVRTAGGAPRINHECVLSVCSRTRLESMFPECDL